MTNGEAWTQFANTALAHMLAYRNPQGEAPLRNQSEDPVARDAAYWADEMMKQLKKRFPDADGS